MVLLPGNFGAYVEAPLNPQKLLADIEAALRAGGVPTDEGKTFDDLDNKIPGLRNRGKYIERNGLFLVWYLNTTGVYADVQTYPLDCFDTGEEARYPDEESWGASVTAEYGFGVTHPNDPQFTRTFGSVINGKLKESVESLGRAFMAHK